MAIYIRRREFITLLGGAATWPPAARAQQAVKLPTIGFLGAGTQTDWNRWTAAFVQRLRELGWIEDRTIAIEYRWAEGRYDRFAEIAAEFVRLKVDLIVSGGSAVPAMKQATSVIPIVFAVANEPVDSGLVASLARPGGNVTGLSMQQTDLAGKRLELVREVIPGLRQLGILANISNRGATLDMGQAQDAARTLGLISVTREIRRAEEIALAFDALEGHVGALYVVGDALMVTNRVRVITMALAARLPTVFNSRIYVEAGGLMSYGIEFAEHYRRSADIVDKILRGARPADIPVEQPTKFDLVINLTTVKALGLTIPQSLLARADKVIE
jgi:putative ABC transport system substrate-binding protein